MDIDAIALGDDFVKAIETTVIKCDVLIAVIGNNWLNSKDEHGERRLDNPEDFVRMEIGTALKRDICVIPVLVDSAVLPRATDLPEDLKPLIRRNALRITDTSFEGDCQRLIVAIRQVLEKPAAEEQERQEKERSEAVKRQREAKERVETVQREREKKERLQNEQRKREEKERLAAEQRERENQRLVTERRENRRKALKELRDEISDKGPGLVIFLVLVVIPMIYILITSLSKCHM